MDLSGDSRFSGIADICLIRIGQIVVSDARAEIIMLGEASSVDAENVRNVFSFKVKKLGFGIEINSHKHSPLMFFVDFMISFF